MHAFHPKSEPVSIIRLLGGLKLARVSQRFETNLIAVVDVCTQIYDRLIFGFYVGRLQPKTVL